MYKRQIRIWVEKAEAGSLDQDMASAELLTEYEARNAALERVRRKLRTVPDGDRRMVEVLGAVLTDGLPAVEAACAEALNEGVHSADVILNILARRRDPGPPVTIMTPEALRLTCAPIADCDRYDSLRRAI